MKEVQKAVLLLEDGTVFEGVAMGSLGKAMGTVVFNTLMVGYQETLTTPANHGLLITQTFPLIGNYGVNDICWESEDVCAAGYIVREICEKPSNYLCKGTLQDFLSDHQVVGICGIDTRHLTKLIREKGEMKGMILSGTPFTKDACLAELRDFLPQDGAVSCQKKEAMSTYAFHKDSNPQNPQSEPYQIAVLNLGITNSMIKALGNHNVNLHSKSITATAEQILADFQSRPDGILISDGPGNPDECPQLIETVKQLCQTGIPILGVSLGHQILALANGIGTTRLKHGHRGANQPVYSVKNGRTYITTQNHSYLVDSKTIVPAACEVTFTNANDQTCEGLSYRNIPAFSVQFLPDAETHTHSTAFIWDEFVRLMKEHQKA